MTDHDRRNRERVARVEAWLREQERETEAQIMLIDPDKLRELAERMRDAPIGGKA